VKGLVKRVVDQLGEGVCETELRERALSAKIKRERRDLGRGGGERERDREM
jgi:hypothetical protein